jgi:hypothetical protein
METGLWFKMFLFLIGVGVILSLMPGGGTMPTALNLTIANQTFQLASLEPSQGECTQSGTNSTQTCYYNGGGGIVNGSYCDSNPVPGCDVTCYDNTDWMGNIARSFTCITSQFINFVIWVINGIIYVCNFFIYVGGVIVSIGQYIIEMAAYFTGVSRLFGIGSPPGTAPLVPEPLNMILGTTIVFMWGFLIFEFVTSFRGMFLPK